jgi:hypothetical protein
VNPPSGVRLRTGRVLWGPTIPAELPPPRKGWHLMAADEFEVFSTASIVWAWSLVSPLGARAQAPAVLASFRLTEGGAGGYLQALEVRRDLRGRGLGAAAWKHLVRLHPEVREWVLMPSARRFWLNQGWTPLDPTAPASLFAWRPDLADPADPAPPLIWTPGT